MLDTWERESTDDVLDRIEQESGDLLDGVRLAGQLTFSDARSPGSGEAGLAKATLATKDL